MKWTVNAVMRPAITEVTDQDLQATIIGQSVYIRKLECILYTRENHIAELEKLRGEALNERDEARRERDTALRERDTWLYCPECGHPRTEHDASAGCHHREPSCTCTRLLYER